MSQWYVLDNGNKKGPYSDDQLQGLVNTGSLKKQDYLWADGLSEWTQAESLDGINWGHRMVPPVAAYAPPLPIPQYGPQQTNPMVQRYATQPWAPGTAASSNGNWQQESQQKVVSVGDWVLTLFVLTIPIANIVLLLIWAFDSSTPRSKSNFAKASLIWMLVALVLYIFLFAIIGLSLFDLK